MNIDERNEFYEPRSFDLKGNLYIDLAIFFAIFLAVALLLPHQQSDTPTLNDEATVVQYMKDGSSFLTEAMLTQNATSGAKRFEFCDKITNEEYGTLRWSAELIARADADGQMTGECSVAIYNNTWKKGTTEITVDGDTVTCELIIWRRFFWIPMIKDTYTLTITRNADGTFA